MRISYTSNPFRFFIIFTAFIVIYFALQKKKTNEDEVILNLSLSFETSTNMYSSILGPNLDKLPNQDDVIELFQVWKKDHGRVYNDLEEMAKKFDIFVSNLKYITETNAKRDSPHSSLLGLTNFADLSFTEFKERYSHNIDMSKISETVNIDIDSTCSNLPPSWDWRTEKAVTSVKEQGSCGSCASFSAVGAVEGIVAIKKKKLLDLSAQELVDCTGNGCNGIHVADGLQWILNNKGVALESKYPYTGEAAPCQASKIPKSESSKIDSVYHVDHSEKGLLCAVAKQPISVCIYANTFEFQHYKTGIFRGIGCPDDPKNITHCMLIVGYDSHEGEEYWIVKNSHGIYFGMGGYMYIERNTSKPYGVCAINAWAVYPNKDK